MLIVMDSKEVMVGMSPISISFQPSVEWQITTVSSVHGHDGRHRCTVIDGRVNTVVGWDDSVWEVDMKMLIGWMYLIDG